MRNTIAIAIAVLSLIGLMTYQPHATVQTTEIVTEIPISTEAPVAVVRQTAQAEAPYAVEEAVERNGGTLVGTEVVENVEAVEAPVPDEVSEAGEIPWEDTESATEAVEQSGESLGEYRITFYCDCPECCGSWSGSPTASGAYPTSGWTIACGEDIPFGTLIEIDGHVYCCEDRGVGSGCIDIYVDDHAEALARGMYYTEVYAR